MFNKAASILAIATLLATSLVTGQGTARSVSKATLKQIRPSTLGNPLKGMAFSAFVHYKELDGPREFTYNGTDFTTFLFNKPMYSSPDDNSLPIGRALYNVEIFDEVVGSGVPGKASAIYQSTQFYPVTDKKGKVRNITISLVGRVEYTLLPGQRFPANTGSKILSIAVTSLETAGLSCTRVGINPVPVSDFTEYVIDARKASCVRQSIVSRQ